MDSILFQSKYYLFWHEYVELTSKKHVIKELKKFDQFLISQGFEGDLDFDRFHASRQYPNQFLPIQENFIDKFVLYLINEYRATKGVLYNAISSLKNFFLFLYEMELISHNPMENYPNPYYSRPIINTALSVEECLALLYAAMKKDPFFRQDFVMIWFMLVTGVRNSEIRLLPYYNVNVDNRMVLLDKGQKGDARSTSITEALALELNRYMGHPCYKEWIHNGNNTLFFNETRILSDQKLREKLTELCINAGIRRITPHDLRRTAGYLMQKSGMHIVEIQQQLGHKILSTTLRYIPPLEELSAALLKLAIK